MSIAGRAASGLSHQGRPGRRRSHLDGVGHVSPSANHSHLQGRSVRPFSFVELLMRLNFCVASGCKDGLNHHHLWPRVHGGEDDGSNLVTLCGACHGRVHGAPWSNDWKAMSALESAV
jgi:HNH endonuclease